MICDPGSESHSDSSDGIIEQFGCKQGPLTIPLQFHSSGINLQIRFWSNKSHKQGTEREKLEVQQRFGSLDAVGDKNGASEPFPVLSVCCMTAETNEIHIQYEWERERETKGSNKGVRRGHVCHRVVNKAAHTHTSFTTSFSTSSPPPVASCTLPHNSAFT